MTILMEKSLKALLKDSLIKILESCKHQVIKENMRILRNK